MLQLVYMSTAPVPPSDEELHALCEQGARNNRQHEITGVLLCHGGYYLQALEGPKVAVEDTFLRIIADPRHHSLQVLSRKVLTAREFGHWAMCTCDTQEDEQTVIDRVDRMIADAPDHLRRSYVDCFDPTCVPADAARPLRSAQQ